MAYQKTWNKWKKPAPIVKVPRVERTWSVFQNDIFKDIESGTGNTQVIARAGSGKTSTIVEGFYHIPAGRSAMMCAFNRDIKIELESRAPEGVYVSTLHALGFKAVRRVYPNIGKPDNDKLDGHIRAERGSDDETWEARVALAKAVSLCKGYLAESYEEIDPILDRHEVDIGEESRESFIASAIKIMQSCKKDTSRVDFDDMIWFPNVLGMKLDPYQMVFIDEAQDLNLAQINLALNSCSANGRIISVGDPAQAIYGFRGADSNAIDNIVKRCRSKTYPLSVTYRCAKSIVDLAKTVVPDLEAAPNAEEGSVEYISDSKIEDLVRPGDFILSRINAPLIGWCLALLKAHIPANIQGRDLGKGFLSMIKKSKAKDVTSFLSWLEDWKNVEVERLVAKKRDPATLQDKAECLVALCEGTNSLVDVKGNIDKLFHDGDDKDRVMLSSTHKAKGLERDRVFMLSKTYKPARNQEEANLWYVATTRARKNLFMVS